MGKFKIGIDTSTTNTAVVVLEDGKLLRFELISPKSKDLIERSIEICAQFKYHFHNVNIDDVTVGIEGASFMSTGKRDKLVMLMGYVYYHLMLEGFAVKLLPPSTIKKQFTGNGRAKKEEVISCLPKEVRDSFEAHYKKIDDLADAYAIASIL